MSKLQVSRKGIDLIQSFEGFRAKAAALKAGGWTVGFGHKTTARDGMVVNRDQAEELLRWDIAPIEDAIRQNVFAPLNQNQFDALASFVFNIGIDEFKSSEVLKHLNQGEFISAAIELAAWRRAHINGQQIVIDALVRRRTQEAALFLETIGPRPAAPTPIVKPLLDYSASLLSPKPDAIKEIQFAQDSVDPEIRDALNPVSGADYVAESIGLKNDTISSDEVLPFPNSDKTMQNDATLPNFDTQELPSTNTKEQSQINAANTIEEENVIVANDIASKGSEISFESEKVSKSVSKTRKFDFDPFTLFVIFAGIIAFAAGSYETYVQGILKNGLFAANLTANQIFILMTAIVGFVAALLSLLGLFADDGE